MKIKGISLFSGGLDSILACKVIAEQGIEIAGISFETPFFSADRARETAMQIGLSLEVINITQEHLQILHSPRWGYGKNMNPCIDCRVLMFHVAGRMMEERGADFLFTGEIVGQRPMSQGKNTLLMTAKNAGVSDRILRPLSAKLLPETEPERDGKVDRSKLFDLQGRGRKRQMEMAAAYGIFSWPPPAGGCLLTDPVFSRRLRDLFEHSPDCAIRDIELLKVGRHFRLNAETKVVVGRNSSENSMIEKMYRLNDALLRAESFPGPTVLVAGGGTQETLHQAMRLCLRYSDVPRNEEAAVLLLYRGRSVSIKSQAMSSDESEALLL